MNRRKRLPSPQELVERYPIPAEAQGRRDAFISEVKAVLCGASPKKLLLVGPCSADAEAPVLAYMERLAGLCDCLRDRFVVVPRVYTSKPRTSGLGYKGMLHRPDVQDGKDDLIAGVVATRRLHLAVIRATGMFAIDEMLYPDMLDYVSDLLAYVAVGARSVENQEHRLWSSGLDIPVGMKNPTSGDTSVLLNAIRCAQTPQTVFHGGWAVSTDGNPYAHAVVRGYSDNLGRMHPNFHFEDLCDLQDAYVKSNLAHPAVIVDCSHANSRKRYVEQPRIAHEVLGLCSRDASLNKFVKGLMIESYLEDGCQLAGEGVFGKSMTDACLGWSRTERLLKELHDDYCW